MDFNKIWWEDGGWVQEAHKIWGGYQPSGLTLTNIRLFSSTVKSADWIYTAWIWIFQLLSSVQPSTPLSCLIQLSSLPSCCDAYSPSLYAACWRGEAPEQTQSKWLIVLPFLCMPTSYCTFSQHESDFSNIQQCSISAPQPTHPNTTTGRHELLSLTGTQAPLPPFFVCHLIISSQFTISQIGDLTPHPHWGDAIRLQLLSRPQQGDNNCSRCSWESHW